MTVRKPFSREAYEAYDTPARDALVVVLLSQGHLIESNKDDYNVDVVSAKNGNTFYNECEIKVGWTDQWPETWEEIRIPHRKIRLLDKYQKEEGFLNFYIFDKHLTQAWKISGSSLTEDRLREARGRYIPKGEKFYHIPYTEAELVKVPE